MIGTNQNLCILIKMFMQKAIEFWAQTITESQINQIMHYQIPHIVVM